MSTQEPIDRAQALRMFHDLASRLVAYGYNRRDLEEMFRTVLSDLRDLKILEEHAEFNPAVRMGFIEGDHPYARGTCTNCGAVHLAWTEYQWSQMVRAPCRSCGKPW